ncbi:MAG TPA: HRDC domain-containing protein, partial [Nitrospirota bacterium]|nr:HRDC domain-containing protein [Nitrospirota bacterium]
AGAAMLTGSGRVSGIRREEGIAAGRRRKTAGAGELDRALFERLRALRKRIAEDNHVPPYIIFSDKTLHEMCRHFPVTADSMRRIAGVGDVKLERYGGKFIAEIKAYRG